MPKKKANTFDVAVWVKKGHCVMHLHVIYNYINICCIQNIDEATQAAEDERVNNAKTLAEIQVRS